ncbi:MAG TPA: cell division ATP-binding protein FtsE [Clostridiaceae bacterium]|nr:cell division ATP-binding protein FtsE [Clostridiaceae bacterium]HBF78162.1 cell division ATP-binding protein FtsE [Clostridiaceae bacterium]HBN28909.1 cell division ATP-binding protein FtsE [Clostridiaceae bacterium]HBX47762.1 cell division ATP-binding protein FtsE [Clostridiaceae bacterium]
MIEIKNVSKVYKNNVIALSNVNISINKGEFIFLVGPSGAGKTTFVKLLLREIEPTSGEIYVNNIDINKLKRRQVPYYRRNIGVVFQDFRLLNNKTAYENVAFAMRIVGASSKEIKKRVPQVLSQVGLSSKLSSYPNQLSGGEQQRVVLARALVNNPVLLICDEPTGNLDPETANGIMEILDNINKSGTTILMATHARDLVDRMKKRVIAIEKGVIVRDQLRGVYGYED